MLIYVAHLFTALVGNFFLLAYYACDIFIIAHHGNLLLVLFASLYHLFLFHVDTFSLALTQVLFF